MDARWRQGSVSTRVGALAACLLVLTLSSSAGTALASPNPYVVATLTLSPNSGPGGTLVLATGGGYASNQTVKIKWDSLTGTVLATTTANGSGNISVTFSVPPGASLGTHVVYACNESATLSCSIFDEFTSIGEAEFTVTSPTPTSVPVCQGDEQMSFDPTSPLVGQEVIVRVTSAKAHVNVRLEGPYSPEYLDASAGGLGYVWRWKLIVGAPGVAQYRFYAQDTFLCATGEFVAGAAPTSTATVTPTLTPTLTATPTVPPELAACEVTGEPGEVLIDFEEFPEGTQLNDRTVGGVAQFLGIGYLLVSDPAVPTQSETRALINDFRPGGGIALEFGSLGLPLHLRFTSLQDFVGVHVGLNQDDVYALEPFTATLTAYGPDGSGRRVAVGTDSVTLGREATPIQNCLSVEAPGRILEVEIDYDAYESEAIDDLILRGPEEPVAPPPDELPPEVSIEVPEEGGHISGRYVAVYGSVREDWGLRQVTLYVNGSFRSELGASGRPPLIRFALDALTDRDLLVRRENTIEVRAIDSSGNRGSDSVTFFYDPPPTPTATPSLDIMAYKYEITQAVQCLENPSCGPDNSIPIYSGKPILVRLYVHKNGAGGDVPGVWGRLCATRYPSGRALSTCVESLNRVTVTGTDNPVRDHRGDLSQTLNFLIPQYMLTYASTSEWRVSVNPPSPYDTYLYGDIVPECCFGNNFIEFPFRLTPSKSLDIVMVRVRSGGSVVPGASERWTTLDYLRKVYPTGNITIWRPESDAVLSEGYDFTDTSGDGCGDDGWDELLDDLWWENFWIDDPVDWMRYYGMVDESVPHAAHGCGYRPGDESGGMVNTDSNPGHTVQAAGKIFAEEIGHNHGRRHSPGCGAGSPDPRYPAGTDAAGNTGISILDEWGTDVEDMIIYPPTSSYDVMGYCRYSSQVWASAYQYRALASAIRRVARAPMPDPNRGPWLAAPPAQNQEYLVGSVFVTPDSAELRRGFYRLPVPQDQEVPDGEAGSYVVELRDAAGQTLLSRLFDPRERSNHEAGVTGIYQIVVPWQPETAEIVVLREGASLLSVQVSANPPSVMLLSPNGGERWPGEGSQTVRWEGSDPDGDELTYSLQYSTDGGQLWSFMAMDVTGTSYEVEAGALAGSEQARIRVWATDGVNTAFDESDAVFSVGAKGPEVFIASPDDGSSFAVGRQVVFQGYAVDLEDGALQDDSAFVWSSDRDGELGTGPSLWGLELTEGEHRITLTVTDQDGSRAAESVNITVLGDQAVEPEPFGIDPTLVVIAVAGAGLVTLLVAGAYVLGRRRPA